MKIYRDEVPNTSTSAVDAEATTLQNNPNACLDFDGTSSPFRVVTCRVTVNTEVKPHSTRPGIKLVTGPIKNKFCCCSNS
jgi:hypothetical protein